MSLGGDVAAALPFFRGEAVSLMLSVGVVRRPTGVVVTDPVTLEETAVFATVYEGVCRLKAAGTIPGRADVPGAVAVTQGAVLSLPVGAPGAGDVRLNDVWECTANFYDPRMVGRRVRVTGIHSQTFATAHRYPVEEVL